MFLLYSRGPFIALSAHLCWQHFSLDAEQCVRVILTDPPPTVVKPDDLSVIPGDIATFTCLAHSTVDFNLTWLRYNSSLDEYLELSDNAEVFANGSLVIRSIDVDRMLSISIKITRWRRLVHWQSRNDELISLNDFPFITSALLLGLCQDGWMMKVKRSACSIVWTGKPPITWCAR